MSYFLELDERTVVPFLENRERVSEAMQEAIEDCLDRHLGQHGDYYCRLRQRVFGPGPG